MLSVIINTKNEEKNIANCLHSIRRQNFNTGKMEIIVVDNNSTDHTKEIARQYTDKVFNVGPERSAQRNFGARQAQGEILGFVDADMILSSRVIAEVAEKFESDKNLAGLYINEKIVDSVDSVETRDLASLHCQSFFCKMRNLERQFYNMTPIDAVRFMRREDFFTVAGFDENLFACEDWDLQKRLTRLTQKSQDHFDILKAIIYHNEKEKKLKDLIAKKKYYAGSFQRYIAKWGREDADVKKQFGFWYRYFGVFIENKKWKKILKHPVLFLAVYFSKIIVGFVYLFSKKIVR